MVYSLCFVLQTLDFMDAAGSLKIWFWAQDSWKQICFNKLWITESTKHSHLQIFRCMSKKLLFKLLSDISPCDMLPFWLQEFPIRSAAPPCCSLTQPSTWLRTGKLWTCSNKKTARIYARTSGKILWDKNFKELQKGILNQWNTALKLN